MALASPDTTLDILHESISHLDFDPTCEHSQHAERHPGDEPAKYLVKCSCDACGDSTVYLLCKPGWVHLQRTPVLYCNACGCRDRESVHIKILEEL